MMLFLKLLLAHLLGDFLLQPQRWTIHQDANKITSKYLYLHIFLHFVLVWLVLWDLSLWYLAAAIAVSHYLIDLLRLYIQGKFQYRRIPFMLGQLLHVAVLGLVAYYMATPRVVFGDLFSGFNWALLTALVFVTQPVAVLMAYLLEGMSDQIETDHKSLPNAGRYIGILERLFVLVFIVIGRWDAIGLLITAKSVFRFNDLKESNSRKLTEYILIGTLLSFGFAILTGLLYNYFIYNFA
ncbi:DUF3307 domain-containing protein [Zeaxanthinibacter enoshimensis]|uniref:Uncharacterized protein DUF3307 n=1 Tax=Zeaxanthinibacter enoshimensis TaxID=392009 RepID=A0A4R6TGV0_9FLAO|nr:DUF3307 domain-containing protein [Zeaxanthinibacter enoshimensis]TDQ29477.1 uncharacterized protein DUF3307 [Zeaxanthinibacter enoshimensis]